MEFESKIKEKKQEKNARKKHGKLLYIYKTKID